MIIRWLPYSLPTNQSAVRTGIRLLPVRLPGDVRLYPRVCLIAQSKPDEACAVGSKILNATEALESYIVVQQLLGLRRLLRPYRSDITVAVFLAGPCPTPRSPGLAPPAPPFG